jgi:hypothetical protein
MAVFLRGHLVEHCGCGRIGPTQLLRVGRVYLASSSSDEIASASTLASDNSENRR